jgi:PAS domain S-box-containing protein
MTIVLQALSLFAQIFALYYAMRLLRLTGRPKSGTFITTAIGLLGLRTALAIAEGKDGSAEGRFTQFGEVAMLFCSAFLAIGLGLLRAHARRRALARLDPNESTSLTAGPPKQVPPAAKSAEPPADDSTEPLLVCNADMEIVEANQGACRLLGREQKDVYGVSVTKLVRREEMLLVPELFRLARSGETQGGEWTFRRPDDSLLPVRVTSRCRQKDSVRLTLHDISEERAAQQATASTGDNSSIIEQLLDASPDGYVAYDPELKIVAWNTAMEGLTGIPRVQCLNQHLLMHFPIPDELAENDFFLESLEGHTHDLRGATLIDPQTGEPSSVDHHFAPLINPAGQIVGGMVVVRESQALAAPEETAMDEIQPEPEPEMETEKETAEAESGPIPFGAEVSEDESLEEVSLTDLLQVESPSIEPEATPVSEEMVLAEMAFTNAPHVIAVYDLLEGRTVYANRALPAVVGFTETQIADMGDDYLAEIVHPEDQPNLPRMVEDWNDGSGIELRVTEFRVTDPQFNWRWFQSADRVLDRDQEGNVTRIVSVIEDITDRKESERHLRLGEQKYRTFSEHCPTGIWHLTSGGNTHYLNPAMCEILGVETPHLLADRTWRDFLTEASIQRIASEPGTDSDGSGSTWPIEVRHPDGSIRQCILHGAPEFDESGELRGLMASVIDVSEQTASNTARQAEFDERETQLAEHGARIQSLEAQLNETESGLREHEALLVDRDAKIEDLESALHETENQFGECKSALATEKARQAEHDDRARELEESLNECRATLAAVEARRDDSTAESDDLRKRLEQTESKLAESEAQLHVHAVNLGENDSRVQALKDELEESLAQLKKAEARAEEHANRIAEYEPRLQTLQAELDTAAKQREEVDFRIIELEEKLSKSDTLLQDRNNELEESRTKLQESESKLAERDARIAESDTRLQSLQTEIDTNAKQREELDFRILELEENNTKNDALLKEQKDELSKSQARLTETEQQLTERDSRITELELHTKEIQFNLDERDAAVAELSTRATDLETRLRAAESETANRDSLLEESATQIDQLTGETTEQKTELARLGESVRTFEERLHLSESRLNGAGACVWSLDERGNCDFVNQAWRAHTGCTGDEDLGDRWRDRIHGADRDRVVRAIRAASDKRENASFDCRLGSTDGEYRWTRCQVRPLTDHEGGFAGLIITASDIHDHMTAENDLRTTLRWHEWAQKSARLGSWEYHPNDDSGFWNDTSLDLLRMGGRPSPEKFNDFLTQVHPDDHAKITDTNAQVLKSGQAAGQLIFRTHPDHGPVRRLCASVHRAPEEDGSAYFLVGTLLDVTALQPTTALAPARPTEGSAQRGDDRYRKIVEIAGQGVWLMDAEGYTSFVNPAMIRMLGRKYREFVGRHFFEFLESESTSEAEAFLERRVEGISEQAEFRLLHRNGHTVKALLTTSPLRDDDGEIIGCLCMVTDTTALHEKDSAHSETESLSRAILEQSPGYIMRVDAKKIVQYANRALPGFTVRQLVGTPLLNWASPADRDAYDEALDRVFATGIEQALEFNGLGPDEENVRYAARIAPVRKGDQITGLSVVSQILGSRPEDNVDAFTRVLLASQEDERRALAAELHDQFGQSLSATKINLTAIPADKLDEATGKRVTASLESVDKLIERTRELGEKLRPSILDDLGLEPALRWMVGQRADSVGFTAAFHADKLPRLAPETESALYRIVEEALENTSRHAKAKNVSVELRSAGQGVQVTVTDDGTGFNPARLKAARKPGDPLGVTAMTERVRLLGGEFSIVAKPRQGVTLSASVPLAKAKPARRKK